MYRGLRHLGDGGEIQNLPHLSNIQRENLLLQLEGKVLMDSQILAVIPECLYWGSMI